MSGSGLTCDPLAWGYTKDSAPPKKTMAATHRFVIPNTARVSALACFLTATLPAQRDQRSGESAGLVAHYIATLEHDEAFPPQPWTTGPEHVWRLPRMDLQLPAGEKPWGLRAGAVTLVLGVQETNALWAVLLPEQPAEIVGDHPGAGLPITSVWFRFHPAELGRLFPGAAERVDDGVAAWRALVEAKRIALRKLRGSWQNNNQPVVPERGAAVADCETAGNLRRFFSLDLGKGTVRYWEAFAQQQLAPVLPIEKELALAAFDSMWAAFDREYPMFALKGVDWDGVRSRHRPHAAMARTSYEAAAAIGEAVAELRDLHAWVRVDSQGVPGYSRARPINGNLRGTGAELGGLRQAGQHIFQHRTQDGIEYLAVTMLTRQDLVQDFDQLLEAAKDSRALILDLRFNGGGNELLGREIAGRFATERHVYSASRFRNGPKHDDLTEPRPRAFEPRGPWRYDKPVIVLQGQGTMSSAESFAKMLACCPEITTMGDRTAGSSGNPRRLSLPAGIEVNMPRWRDESPDGTPLEDRGVAPDVPLDVGAAAFSNRADPVVAAALKRLRGLLER